MNLGFLVSHNGSNMQAIVDRCRAGILGAEPATVISNNSGSGALDRARREGIPHYHLSSTVYPEPEALDHAISDTLVRHGVDLVILAGYMKKLGARTLTRFRGRIINIHPSLLPRHGGRGMYGIKVHEAVLSSGDQATGVSIHLVDDGYDTGPILAQTTIPIIPGDTPTTLQARVLKREHEFFVETLQRIVAGEIVLPRQSAL